MDQHTEQPPRNPKKGTHHFRITPGPGNCLRKARLGILEHVVPYVRGTRRSRPFNMKARSKAKLYVCVCVSMHVYIIDIYIYICIYEHVVIPPYISASSVLRPYTPPPTFSHLPHCVEEVKKQKIAISKALRRCFFSKAIRESQFLGCGLWPSIGELQFAIRQSQFVLKPTHCNLTTCKAKRFSIKMKGWCT